MAELLKNKRVIKLLMFSIVGMLAASLDAPIEIIFMRKITGSESLASFAFTIATIASIVGVLFFARFGNKIGRKRVITWAFLFNILIPLYYATIYNTMQLYGVRFIWSFLGAGVGTLMGAFIQQEVTTFKEMSGRFYGILYALQSGAGSLSVIAGGFISDMFGFKIVFYVVGAINVIQFLLIKSILKESNETQEVAEKESKHVNIIEGIKFIWENSELRARFFLVTIYGINWSTDTLLYPIIILSLTGKNTSTGIVWGIQGVVAMLALPIIGKIVDKYGYSWVLLIGYTVLGVSTIAFSLSPYFWMMMIAATFVSLGKASNGPSMSTLEVKNIPDYLRNSVVAVHNTYSTIVEVATTFTIGLLISHYRPQSILLCSGFAVILTILLAQTLLRTKSKVYMNDEPA